MNPKNENVKMEFVSLIKNLLLKHQDSNFHELLHKHIIFYREYVDLAREKGVAGFPDRETYQKFIASKLFFDKVKHAAFQSKDGIIKIEDGLKGYNMPPLEAFHLTKDERDMVKNRILENLKKGDVLHLKVVDEDAELYKLQILNKYGDESRIIDCSLSAVLLKSNPLVKQVDPALQVSDLVRATVLGNVKQEEGLFKKILITLNPDVMNKDLKHLKLGRIFKRDVDCPKDITDYRSFGAYLQDNVNFETPRQILQQISAFGCDPLKTGPLYETRVKKHFPGAIDNLLSEETLKLNISCDKSKKAVELLNSGELSNALLEIEDALKAYPENDVALTIRGKIYLAMAGGKPSKKVKAAFLDFEAAVGINFFNSEATALRDAMLLESKNRFSQRNMPENAEAIQARLNNPDHANKDAEAFLKSIKDGSIKRQVASKKPVAEVPTISPAIAIKEEKMDVE